MPGLGSCNLLLIARHTGHQLLVTNLSSDQISWSCLKVFCVSVCWQSLDIRWRVVDLIVVSPYLTSISLDLVEISLDFEKANLGEKNDNMKWRTMTLKGVSIESIKVELQKSIIATQKLLLIELVIGSVNSWFCSLQVR